MIKEFLQSVDIQNKHAWWLIGAFLLAFFISYRAFGPLMVVAKEKNLFDEPDDRSVHSKKVPTLGGIGVYLSVILVLSFSGAVLNSRILIITSGAITLLFFLGLKDDLLVLSPKKKFIGQILASTLLITSTDIRIVGFLGIFGIDILPFWASIIFTVFVFILIINAFNLIDGIDGLAGSIAVLAACTFGLFFYQAHNINASTIAFTLVGALLPFLRLNFSKSKKIFMGDTGSMVIGFLLAFFAVAFMSDAYYNPNSGYSNSAPIMTLAILFFPLMDTFRIFVIRIFIHKKSPFIADRNHVHHRILGLGYSHKMTTAIIVVINMVIIALAYYIGELNIHLQLVILLVFGLSLYSVPFMLKVKNSRLTKTFKNQSKTKNILN